eukprot:5985412-Amphidinium_carterae.1
MLGGVICAARTFQLLDGAHKSAQRTKHIRTCETDHIKYNRYFIFPEHTSPQHMNFKRHSMA